MRLPICFSSSRKPGASMYRMIAGKGPAPSGHAANAGWRPYLVLTMTSCSIIGADLRRGHRETVGDALARFQRPRIEQLACARDQHVVDPHVVHEVFAHTLAHAMNAVDALGDSGLDVRVRRIAGVAERLGEIEHPEAQIVDARQ